MFTLMGVLFRGVDLLVQVSLMRLLSPARVAEDTAVARHRRSSTGTERRRRLRFPLDADLWYESIGKHELVKGHGRAQDISSAALAFHADGILQVRMRLRISIGWPVMLGDKARLRLVFVGDVVMMRGNLAVVTISRREFRTAGWGSKGDPP
jgi:hypothetical protein